jgi:hypothetical protein
MIDGQKGEIMAFSVNNLVVFTGKENWHLMKEDLPPSPGKYQVMDIFNNTFPRNDEWTGVSWKYSTEPLKTQFVLWRFVHKSASQEDPPSRPESPLPLF